MDVAAEAAVGAAAARLDAVAALLLALEGTVVEETAEASGAIEEDTIAAATEGASEAATGAAEAAIAAASEELLEGAEGEP